MLDNVDDLEVACGVIARARDTGPAILRYAAGLPQTSCRSFLLKAAQHLWSYRESAEAYHRLPVDIETFIRSDRFLASGESIYPAVMDELREINSGQYVEAVLTGAIGTGKTTIALLTIAYQLHVLSCLRDPHAFFKLESGSEIVFAIQSVDGPRWRKTLPTNVLRTMIDKSRFFESHFRCRPTIKSEMVFPHNIIVRPLSSKPTAAIGSNIIGGILDEVNFFPYRGALAPVRRWWAL
jgi:hypothetical protein